jgi:mono/diheme cytochrome c family protein
MSYIRGFVVIIVTAVVFVSLTPSAAFAQDPDNGKVLWEEQVWQCQRCHGEAGEGKYGGPRAGDGKTAAEWIAQVRTPRRFMPALSEEQVSDEQLTDMHAYMNSLAKPADFSPLDPGTAENEGQNLLLQKRCVACHTEANGEAGFMAKGMMERGVTPTAESVTKQLRTPFRNMPAYRADQVSDADAALIADFLVELVSAETPPAALPTAGGGSTSTLPVQLMLIGGGLLLAGLALWRLRVREL